MGKSAIIVSRSLDFLMEGMMNTKLAGLEHPDVKRHWSPESEAFAGGDALASMIHSGWRIQKKLYTTVIHLSGARSRSVCCIELERDGRSVQMHVMCNPYINRILSALNNTQVAAVGHSD